MYRFSAASLLRNAFSGQKNWPKQFRSAEPRSNYQAVMVGGGGHGLSAAYHLANEFVITNIAVIEKGWIGGGNTGLNVVTFEGGNRLWTISRHLLSAQAKLVKRTTANFDHPRSRPTIIHSKLFHIYSQRQFWFRGRFFLYYVLVIRMALLHDGERSMKSA